MDLSKWIPQEEAEKPKLSKEEYAAMKKKEREEVWAEVDTTAQEVFQDSDSLKKFLDFMALCKPQKTSNLLLLYSQNPEIRQVRTLQKWREEHRTLKPGVQGYRFIEDQEYEKDGVIEQGYKISKAYDISQIRMKPPVTPEPKPLEELLEAVLKEPLVPIRIDEKLPDKVQAQYVPKQRTIYVKNGMSELVTLHSINRENAYAALDQHDGNYERSRLSAQAYCAAYVVAKKYQVNTDGFRFGQIAALQENGQKDPRELRGFLAEVRSAAYRGIQNIDRNLSAKQQEFSMDAFTIQEEGIQDKGEKKKKREESVR